MAPRHTLTDLRESIQRISREVLAREGDGEVSNATIISLVREQNSAEIQHLSDQLIDRTLVKLLNDVSGRRLDRSDFAEGKDLFGEYRVRRMLSIGRGRRKDVLAFSIGQIERYIEEHSKKASNDRYKDLRQLIEDVRKHELLETDTLSVLLERAKQAKTHDLRP